MSCKVASDLMSNSLKIERGISFPACLKLFHYCVESYRQTHKACFSKLEENAGQPILDTDTDTMINRMLSEITQWLSMYSSNWYFMQECLEVSQLYYYIIVAERFLIGVGSELGFCSPLNGISVIFGWQCMFCRVFLKNFEYLFTKLLCNPHLLFDNVKMIKVTFIIVFVGNI